MRYDPEHKAETRKRIIDAAGRVFRSDGFCGVGVDALAESADVTSGGLYGHFRSKAAVFRAVALAGLERLRLAIERYRAQNGQDWLRAFAEYYLGTQHRQNIAGGCGLPSLTPEVVRADASTKAACQAELLRAVEAMAAGLPGTPAEQRAKAWVTLALMAGGVTLSRSVSSRAVADEIAAAVRQSIEQQPSR
jgi:TetR/AcrR family transcriptional regulator, transcriptional repressor for nem operon